MTLRPASPSLSHHLTPDAGPDSPTTDVDTRLSPDHSPAVVIPDISHPEPRVDPNADTITDPGIELPDVALPDQSTGTPSSQDTNLQHQSPTTDSQKKDAGSSSGRRGEVHVEMPVVGLPKLEVAMFPMMIMLRGVGVGPPTWNTARNQYETGFRNVAGAARAMAATSLIFLTVLSTLAIGYHVLGFSVQNEKETAAEKRLKLVGVVIVGGYQVNACIQVANILVAVNRHAHLLTCWKLVIDSQHIPLPPRLRLRCLVQVFFMLFFSAAMVAAAALGRPRLLAVVLDGLAERLYFLPYTWISHHPTVSV